ncbi:hypothetical protein [uncultured Anaerococcus sp.]|uniref:hypothetical protein n=1 Tax=uncultured Anaerococcus sp. TaxID=293428 RepID=UPI0025DDB835|nr:hypothetical protein [uncultured Anaerococcus sp.]
MNKERKLTRKELDDLGKKEIKAKETLEKKRDNLAKRKRLYEEAEEEFKKAEINHEIAYKNHRLGFLRGLTIEELPNVWENLEKFMNDNGDDNEEGKSDEEKPKTYPQN